MVRTQIQLTEEQARSLKKISLSQNISMAELIRRGVELTMKSENVLSDGERKQRAIAAAGAFHSGMKDVARDHDAHLAETFLDQAK